MNNKTKSVNLIDKFKIKSCKDFVLDLVFPKYCVGCEKEGVWLCDKCFKKIIIINKPFCPNCHRLTPKGQFCSRCRKKTNLTGVIIAAHYEEGPLKEAIHTYKYDGMYDLSQDLGNILIHTIASRNIAPESVILPVPLHKSRHNQRGFNQAYLLALKIKEKFPDLKINNTDLVRIRKTSHQVNLDRSDRIKNAVGQYKWVGNNMLANKTVYLIDDIYTTGATLNECARVLRRNTKVREVWGIVLAKG